MRDVEAELVRRLEAQPDVGFALLFGSRAGKSPRPDSDWDVAVYLDPAVDRVARSHRRRHLAGELSDLGEIDVVVLNDCPALLAHRALAGRVLLVRDRVAYVRFFVRTIAESEDERYYRELHDRARRVRLEEGRFGRP